MTVEEEWGSIVAPYGRSAEVLGFNFLDRRIQGGIPPSPDTTVSCVDFYFDGEATYLDLGGILACGHYHRGLLIGFNTVQLYTYVRSSHLSLILTNGIPPEAAKRAARQRWNPLVRLLETLVPVPDDHSGVSIRGPEDLGRVVERHRALIASRGESRVFPGEPTLEARWAIADEWEASESPW